MEKSLIKIEQMPMNEIMTLGKAFAESGMFTDMKTAAQAFVKIQAGQEMGIPPFAAMSGIHIIQGKPSVGAGLIASRIKSCGKYNYRIVQNDDKACSIDFFEGSEKIGNSTFTIEDAKRAQTKNLDKFPRNMLFARAISNGAKWYCPDAFNGPVYSDGEIQDIASEVISTEINNEIPEQPLAITEKDYKTATNDTELIVKLIDEATDPGLLRTFHTVNIKFFKSNEELDARLREKGIALKNAAKVNYSTADSIRNGISQPITPIDKK